MTSPILVLGGTGKTGRRVSAKLRAAGQPVRSAARSGADVAFDWSDPGTHDAALADVERIYLVPPTLRLDFAADVSRLVDRAQEQGVRHITFLSARGVEQAPPEVAMRAVELDLADRPGLTHTILRPTFFMQNFTEGAYDDAIASGVLALPAGDGAEAFIDVDDIAAAAAASLLDPAAHAGKEYELAGPQALTHTQVAEALTAHGRPVTYQAVPLQAWVEGATAAGVPAEYAGWLGSLLAGIGAGHGSRPGPGVRDATGREPTSFDAVLARG